VERVSILNSIAVTEVNPYVSWMFTSIWLQYPKKRTTWPRAMADVDKRRVLAN